MFDFMPDGVLTKYSSEVVVTPSTPSWHSGNITAEFYGYFTADAE